MELASVDAFLAGVSPESLTEIKKKLAEKFFGNEAGEVRDDPPATDKVVELAGNAVKLAEAAVKK